MIAEYKQAFDKVVTHYSRTDLDFTNAADTRQIHELAKRYRTEVGKSDFPMANPQEWFADSWRSYMAGGPRRAQVRKTAPTTADVIEEIMRGGYKKR